MRGTPHDGTHNRHALATLLHAHSTTQQTGKQAQNSTDCPISSFYYGESAPAGPGDDASRTSAMLVISTVASSAEKPLLTVLACLRWALRSLRRRLPTTVMMKTVRTTAAASSR